jgi:phosphatidylserine/phosphatidylglycerophosphate/cardiolipin synthase-like enzyme
VGQPSGIDALFSPNGGIQDRIVAEIDQETSTIDIAMYSFTADEIRDALIRAKDRGIQIRIVADSGQSSGQGGEIPTLEGLSFMVRRLSGFGGGLMHNKFMIVDQKILFTGSYNWSANAEDNSFENAVFIEGDGVIQSFLSDFERLW